MRKTGRLYCTTRQIENEVQTLAEVHGLDGDPLQWCTQIGALEDEYLILDLYLQLPVDLRRAAPSLCRGMVRSLVMSSSLEDDTTVDTVPTVENTSVPEDTQHTSSAMTRATAQARAARRKQQRRGA